MNRLLSVLLLSTALPLAACASTEADYGPLSGNAASVGNVDDVELRDAIIRYDNSGLAVYQVTLVNEDDEERWIEWRSRWFDLEGFEINDPSRTWQRVNMQPNGYQPLRSIAPSALATRCEVQVREPKDGLR
jgi:uncharacterized protein YcfL